MLEQLLGSKSNQIQELKIEQQAEGDQYERANNSQQFLPTKKKKGGQIENLNQSEGEINLDPFSEFQAMF